MTRLEALIALKDAVEAGEWNNPAAWRVFGIGVTGRAERAFNGSLDAARALHEAVLPEYSWGLTGALSDGNSRACVVPKVDNPPEYTSKALCPARALLLAIFSALIAMETDR